MKCRRPSAFTLVELLVVIAIIGILGLILVPALGKVRESSKVALGVSNLRQIGAAIHLYANDNQGWLPYAYGRDEQSNVGNKDYSTLISVYLANNGKEGTYGDGSKINTVFLEPLAEVDGGNLHYSTNPVVMVDQQSNQRRRTLYEIQRPSEMIMIFDGCQHPSYGWASSTGYRLDNGGVYTAYSEGLLSNEVAIAPGPNEDTVAGQGHIRWRLQNGVAAKFLFVDGRVDILEQSEVKKKNIRIEP